MGWKAAMRRYDEYLAKPWYVRLAIWLKGNAPLDPYR